MGADGPEPGHPRQCPLALDRIDLHVSVRNVAYQELAPVGGPPRTTSAEYAAQIMQAHQLQRDRGQPRLNGRLQGRMVPRHCILTHEARAVVATSFDKLGLSMRGYHKVLKIARTIADLAGSTHIEATHVQEALSFRLLSR